MLDINDLILTNTYLKNMTEARSLLLSMELV